MEIRTHKCCHPIWRVAYAIVLSCINPAADGCEPQPAEPPSEKAAHPDAIDRDNLKKLARYMKNRFRWAEDGGSWLDHPTREDYKSAAKLEPRVLKAAVAFLRKKGLPEKRLSVARITAARAVHGLLLLDVNFPSVKDGNRHLIYSPASRKILYRFVWYPQG